MITYTEFKQGKQKRFDAFIENGGGFFAFNMEQFDEGLKKCNVGDPAKELFKIGGGGFIRKDMADTFHAILDDNIEKLMEDYDFAKDAFKYEMNNHEYFINWQANWDVLSCFYDVEYDEDGEDTVIVYFDKIGVGDNTRFAFYDARRELYKEWDENGWF